MAAQKSPHNLTPEQTDISSAAVAAQKRRVVRPREDRPLDADRKYVDPDVARSAVTYDLFTWATKHNRPKDNEPRRMRVHVPGEATELTRAQIVRNRQRLQNYFEFGAGSRIKARSGAFELNVHRNRVVFILILTGLLLYSLSWLAS